MSTNWNKQAIAQVCPHLLDSEVAILMDNLHDEFGLNNCYPEMVTAVAAKLFPYIEKQVPQPKPNRLTYLSGRHNLIYAMRCIDSASEALANSRYISDDVANILITCKQMSRMLDEEQHELEGK